MLKKSNLLIFFIIGLILQTTVRPGPFEKGRYYFGIEVNNVLCGYAELNVSEFMKNGKKMIALTHDVTLMTSLLGSKVNSKINLVYHIDPISGRFDYHSSYIKQGPTTLDSEVRVKNDTVWFSASLMGDTSFVVINDNVLLENTLFFPYLKKDFVDDGLKKKTYDIYEVREAKIQKSTYEKTGEEVLFLAGKSYNAFVVNRMTPETGVKIKYWIDSETGMLLQTDVMGNRKGYLADPSVVKKIQIADLDENILTKTNVSIADIKSISYMKVRAKIEPMGLRVTPEKLNFGGQKFTGSVHENLIEGIFEISYDKYDGKNAPKFPAEYRLEEKMEKYIDPYPMIESNDPAIIKKADEITKGASDCWEASVRLSKWVSENIDYAIPGGGSAKKTLEIRAGECGAHSLLLSAFCRAVGIPARMVWGCMYIPNHGGSFGQHGWTEIYMGEAGWIPVDATATEVDYVDAGHVRIGEYESMVISLNAKEMEIIDYKLFSSPNESEKVGYGKYFGGYVNPQVNDTLRIFEKDGRLTLDIPDKVILSFNNPDENGKWYCTMTDRLFVTFGGDYKGNVNEMKIHELIFMPRDNTSSKSDIEAPEEFRKYIGGYKLNAAQATFDVIYLGESLALINPLENRTVKLQLPNDEGDWLDEFNKNKIRFNLDEDNNVSSMVIESISSLDKIAE